MKARSSDSTSAGMLLKSSFLWPVSLPSASSALVWFLSGVVVRLGVVLGGVGGGRGL
jgi:hypothetical protein